MLQQYTIVPETKEILIQSQTPYNLNRFIYSARVPRVMTKATLPLTIITLVLIAAVVLLALGPQRAPTSTDGISVSGEGEIEVMPDLARVYFEAISEHDDAAEAQAANAETIAAARDALEDLGIDRDKVTTERFNVYPLYDYDENYDREPGIDRYEVVHSLKVEVEDISLIGEVLDAAVNAGIDRVNRITFDLTDEREEQLRSDALAQAAEKAREKGESIAKGLGLKLGKVRSVSESNINYYPYERYLGEDVAMAAGTEIVPDELTVSAHLTVVYSVN
ncbi:DUF541 domain-containing protein [Candidatus Woesearchaeota archaeon]|nr:DUF541 domain-containing protein [Candidatus Woesearchaeota archaeon]